MLKAKNQSGLVISNTTSTSLGQIASVVIRADANSIIRLKDVATVYKMRMVNLGEIRAQYRCAR